MEKGNSGEDNIIWNLATIDDEYVAKQVKDNREMDGIYSLKEAGLLDEFFQFLSETEVINLIKEVKYLNIQRKMVEFFQYIFLYIFIAAMELAGFNGYQVKNGICRRGDALRKKKEKQGPICAETLSNNIVKIPKEEVEELLNKAISKLVR